MTVLKLLMRLKLLWTCPLHLWTDSLLALWGGKVMLVNRWRKVPVWWFSLPFRLISLLALCFPNFAWAYHANSSPVWSWTKIWSYTWYKWSCMKMGISTQIWPNVTLWLSYATLTWNKVKKIRICTDVGANSTLKRAHGANKHCV